MGNSGLDQYLLAWNHGCYIFYKTSVDNTHCFSKGQLGGDTWFRSQKGWWAGHWVVSCQGTGAFTWLSSALPGSFICNMRQVWLKLSVQNVNADFKMCGIAYNRGMSLLCMLVNRRDWNAGVWLVRKSTSDFPRKVLFQGQIVFLPSPVFVLAASGYCHQHIMYTEYHCISVQPSLYWIQKVSRLSNVPEVYRNKEF